MLTVLGFLGSLVTVGTASALWYDFGPGSYADLSGTDSNLQIQASVNPNLDSMAFHLDIGQSKSFWFGNFWTPESRIDPGDKRVSNINAYMDFGGFTAMIPGQSFGFSSHYEGNVDDARPFLQAVRTFLSSYPQEGMSVQQIVNALDWSIVPVDLQSQFQAGFSSALDQGVLNGIVPKSFADHLLNSIPDPSTIGTEGFSQGYFVTWNDQIPTLPDGTPDYELTGWIEIGDDPVDIYFGETGHLQLEFSDVFGSGLCWLEPDFWRLPVIAKLTHLADPIPEPGTLLLVATGLAGLIGARIGGGYRRGNRVALS
jgi:hypothetical protein